MEEEVIALEVDISGAKEGLERFTDTVEDLREVISGIGDRIAKAIAPALKCFEQMQKSASTLNDTLAATNTAIQAVSAQLGNLQMAAVTEEMGAAADMAGNLCGGDGGDHGFWCGDSLQPEDGSGKRRILVSVTGKSEEVRCRLRRRISIPICWHGRRQMRARCSGCRYSSWVTLYDSLRAAFGGCSLAWRLRAHRYRNTVKFRFIEQYKIDVVVTIGVPNSLINRNLKIKTSI